MPILLTAQNVNIVLGDDPERLYRVLPEVFERLLEPNLDEFTHYTYCKSIHDRLAFGIHADQKPAGFDILADICLDSGIVKTFLQIAKEPKTEKWPALAAHFALHSMCILMRMGTVDEREDLLKELLEHDVVNFCLDTVKSSPLGIHRHGAVGVLKCLAAESTLGAFLSPTDTSRIIIRMCEFILSGPQFFTEQLGDVSLNWQSFLSFGKFGTPRAKARKYAPRAYAMAQENAAWTIHGLFLRCPPPNNRFCYEMLMHDPSVIDLLFRAANVERSPWYADLEVDGILCESIAMIFRLPELVIPGVDIEVGCSDVQKGKEQDWDALIDCLKLLTSRPKWVELLLLVWNRIEAEKPFELRKFLMEAESKYYAQAPYFSEDFYQVAGYRGSCRICIERLITTLTYTAAWNKLAHDDILSLVYITNAAVRPSSNSPNQGVRSGTEFQRIEKTLELYRKPFHALVLEAEVESPLQVANELHMGPIAHIRLLTLLAANNTLAEPSKISLPMSISTQMTLVQLKQICTPDCIRKVLNVSRKRITAHREVGHKRFRKERDLGQAHFAYATAAELAAAMVNFNDATQGMYQEEVSGAQRERVLCLGNAAEMAHCQGFYNLALCYATAAVQCGKSLPTDNSPDGVDVSVREKNRRRVERALECISAESS